MSEHDAAGFLAVGSELLRAERVDTNSFLAARLLRGFGWRLVEKRSVEDDVDAIATAIRELLRRVRLIVVSGGLGPTADDVTREGVAAALGIEVVRYRPLEEALEARYRVLGRTMPAAAARMADILEGAEILPNPQGTAPGQLVEHAGVQIILLPGVPREFETIFRTNLMKRWPSAGDVVRVLRLGGVYESSVESRVESLYARFGRENVTILASRGTVDLVLSATGGDAAARIAAMESAFRTVVGTDLYGFDAETLAESVIRGLGARGWRVAVAESCTGGMVGAQLTAVPGASSAFVGGAVTYSNHLKERLLGVPASVLTEHGAVSEAVALAMAEGACALGAECGLAVTGIAGPDGGTELKPVGTVHMAAVTPTARRHLKMRFPGDRAAVREFASVFAIDLLRRALEDG